MIVFIFKHILEHKARTITMMVSVIMMVMVTTFSIFLYTNTRTAIHHYTYHLVDKHRLTINASANVLDFLGVWSNNDIKKATIDAINRDPRMHNIQVFRLVEIPVVAKFHFFSFQFETDIPVFSVTDGILSWDDVPVWLSRKMIDFYNSQFAGSSWLFPPMNYKLLIWQDIDLTFGASKIFPPLATTASPIRGKIVQVGDDFPWFGIVLPESIVRKKVWETWFDLWKPFKIVAYLKDIKNINAIKKDYGKLNLVFDQDRIRDFQKKLALIALIVGTLGAWVVSIVLILFIFILTGYFRERREVFRMIWVFWLNSPRSYILTIGEPVGMVIVSSVIGGIVTFFLHHILIHLISWWLTNNGLLFSPENIPLYQYIMIVAMIIFSLITMVYCIENHFRKKPIV